MKYLKKFESINKLEIGDYVHVDLEIGNRHDKNFMKKFPVYPFFKENIGKIADIDSRTCHINYENIPNEIKNGIFYHNDTTNFQVLIRYIKYFSKNKEDVEIFMASQNYNL